LVDIRKSSGWKNVTIAGMIITAQQGANDSHMVHLTLLPSRRALFHYNREQITHWYQLPQGSDTQADTPKIQRSFLGVSLPKNSTTKKPSKSHPNLV